MREADVTGGGFLVPIQVRDVPDFLGEAEQVQLALAAQGLQESSAADKKLVRDLRTGEFVDAPADFIVMLLTAFRQVLAGFGIARKLVVSQPFGLSIFPVSLNPAKQLLI